MLHCDFVFVLFFFWKMQGMSNYVSGSCMSEHNMRTMKIECMQLAEQKHADDEIKMYAMTYTNAMHEYDK